MFFLIQRRSRDTTPVQMTKEWTLSSMASREEEPRISSSEISAKFSRCSPAREEKEAASSSRPSHREEVPRRGSPLSVISEDSEDSAALVEPSHHLLSFSKAKMASSLSNSKSEKTRIINYCLN